MSVILCDEGVTLFPKEMLQGLADLSDPNPFAKFRAWQPIPKDGSRTVLIASPGQIQLATACTDPTMTYYENPNQFASFDGSSLTIWDDNVGGTIDVYDAGDPNQPTVGRIRVGIFRKERVAVRGRDILFEEVGIAGSMVGLFPALLAGASQIWTPANIQFDNVGYDMSPLVLSAMPKFGDRLDADAILAAVQKTLSSGQLRDPFTRLVFFITGQLARRGQPINALTTLGVPRITIASNLITPQTLAHEFGHTFGLFDLQSPISNLMYFSNAVGGLDLDQQQTTIANASTRVPILLRS